MAYLVIAYPKISKEDFSWIQEYRKKNDFLYFDVVEPHFTIIFPVFDIGKEDFVGEVEKLSSDLKQFDFNARCFVVNKDAFNEYYHEFVVPDKGFSDFVKMRDKLYSGILSKNLRLDIDFIPHIGIGNSKNPKECKKRVDELNGKDLEIKGVVDKLSIMKFEDNSIFKIKDVLLK